MGLAGQVIKRIQKSKIVAQFAFIFEINIKLFVRNGAHLVSRFADERGIVMGEFGFITADGIYHVTVYATDEEGRFRIISMKSYPYAGPVSTSE